jgi:hypothetical protein
MTKNLVNHMILKKFLGQKFQCNKVVDRTFVGNQGFIGRLFGQQSRLFSQQQKNYIIKDYIFLL